MTQAMTETDAAVDQTVEDKGASDDLDSLLDQFTEETKPVEQPIDQSDVKEVVNWVNDQRSKEVKQEETTAVNSAVETIKSSLELDFTPTDGMIKGMLQNLASEDPAVAKAFAQRHQNPQAWKSALNRATNAIKEDLNIDLKATEDRNAIASAVRSASTKQPEPAQEVNIAGMTDYEFQQHKANLLRNG